MAKSKAKQPQKSLQTGKSEVGYKKPPVEHQFQPGVSGNPSGRPKLLGESYKEWLAKENAQGITNAEAVALSMGIEAMKGDVSAAKEIRSATEGEKVEHSGATRVEVHYVDDWRENKDPDDSAPETAPGTAGDPAK